MAQKNKAMIGRMGQQRGRVRSVGAIGGARGARFPGNGAARPGALNFLQAPGFGLRPGGPVGGPAMNPVFGGAPPRHVRNPLPTRELEAVGGPGGQPGGRIITTSDTPGEPGYVAPDPYAPPGSVPQVITEPSGRGAGFTQTGGAADQIQFGPAPKPVNGYIPLGNGMWLDPQTGSVLGGFGGPPAPSFSGGGGGGGGGGRSVVM